MTLVFLLVVSVGFLLRSAIRSVPEASGARRPSVHKCGVRVLCAEAPDPCVQGTGGTVGCPDVD